MVFRYIWINIPGDKDACNYVQTCVRIHRVRMSAFAFYTHSYPHTSSSIHTYMAFLDRNVFWWISCQDDLQIFPDVRKVVHHSLFLMMAADVHISRSSLRSISPWDYLWVRLYFQCMCYIPHVIISRLQAHLRSIFRGYKTWLVLYVPSWLTVQARTSFNTYDVWS